MAKGTITVRTEPEIEQQLDALSIATQRSRNWIITEALKQYLATQQWQVEGIWQARRSLQQGKRIPFEDVMSELQAKIDRRMKET